MKTTRRSLLAGIFAAPLAAMFPALHRWLERRRTRSVILGANALKQARPIVPEEGTMRGFVFMEPTDTISQEEIDRGAEKLSKGNFPLRPVMVDGEPKYLWRPPC